MGLRRNQLCCVIKTLLVSRNKKPVSFENAIIVDLIHKKLSEESNTIRYFDLSSSSHLAVIIVSLLFAKSFFLSEFIESILFILVHSVIIKIYQWLDSCMSALLSGKILIPPSWLPLSSSDHKLASSSSSRPFLTPRRPPCKRGRNLMIMMQIREWR